MDGPTEWSKASKVDGAGLRWTVQNDIKWTVQKMKLHGPQKCVGGQKGMKVDVSQK